MSDENQVEEMPVEETPIEETLAEQDQPAIEETPMSENDDTLEKIRQAELFVLKKEIIVNDLKENLKFAKSQMDEAIDNLRRLCRSSMQSYPLFDKKPESESIEQETESENGQAVEGTTPTINERLGDYLISNFLDNITISSFGSAKRKALADAFPTVADFAGRNTDWWSNVKGVGESLAAEIESDFDLFVTELIEHLNQAESSEEDEYEFEDATDYEDVTDDDQEFSDELSRL